MNVYLKTLIFFFGIVGISFIMASTKRTPPAIDPACRDVEMKYQKLLQSEGPDAVPAIVTKDDGQE